MARNKTETQLVLKVPDSLTAQQRREVGDAVVEFIRVRTREGNNVFHRKWSGKAGRYSPQYAEKKGRVSPVDLTFTTEMLETMRNIVSKSKTGEITVGFKKGTKVERKAEGNIQGTYGGKGDGSKARPFLDILQKDLNAIIAEVVDGS